MRSIKQIVREIKYEIKRIVDEEDNKDLEYYDEDNIEDLSFLAEDIPINRLHDYIIENYDKNEIILFTKYLIKDYLFNNYETIIEYVLNNDNVEYKNMVATRLRAIIEDLDIFSSDILNELDDIFKLISNSIDNNDIIIDFDYFQNIIDSIKENNIRELFINDEDYYYPILENFYLENEFILDDTLHIQTVDVNVDKKQNIITLEDCANVILEELYFFESYYTDSDYALDLIDSVLNEEQKIEDKFYKEYTKYIKDSNYIHNEHQLINMMKVNVVKNYYKYKMGTDTILEEEKALIENIYDHLDDFRVLIEIYDNDFDSSYEFLQKCMEYFHYQKEIDSTFKLNKYEKNINNMAIINNKINRTLLKIQNFLDGYIVMDGSEFEKIFQNLDNNTLVMIYTPIGEEFKVNKDDALNYINDNPNITVKFKIDNFITKNILMINYLINTNSLKDKEKEIFIINMCDDYIKFQENDSDILNILNNNPRSTWYSIFKKDKDLSFLIFNNHLQKLSSLNTKFNFDPKTNSSTHYQSNSYEDVLNDIITQLKNDPLEYTNDEISRILYNYLCDIVSIDVKYYQHFFPNYRCDENLLKFIFRQILINHYYNDLKNKENLEPNELDYLDIIENAEKLCIDAYFTSNMNFYTNCINSYFKKVDKLEENHSNPKVLKKDNSFQNNKNEQN